MKNLLGALVLFLAFTVNASAQETFKKVDEKVEAKSNLAALSEVVPVQGTLSEDLFRLFEYKHRNLNGNLSAERKAELAKIIELKLRATLSQEQMQSIESKPGLLKKLTN
ncbi:hypothetical protein [Flavobacterium terrigena]|uniref:Uncharacterized protein n=1 Tax=Flavobacterium terrigena TaxID=402734 RepID=A0A1H6SD88_9FLAO|nr:hypothetical protein [Flavobacterium terrigena]SEI61382.1 hypothetical protein SAMN05660918_1150 [Flavobacterium terrigena]